MYAELQVTSNFSFLRGASHPEELVTTAAELGHEAIAITDRNSLAGIVRAHGAAKEAGIRLVVGARLDFVDAPSLLCFPTDRAAYGRLAELLTLGKRRAAKGECQLYGEDLFAFAEGQRLAVLAPEAPSAVFAKHLRTLHRHFGKTVMLALSHSLGGDDESRIARFAALAESVGLAWIATNDVHYHVPSRRPLQDALTCIRAHCTLEEVGSRLFANAERHLKAPAEMARLFAAWPEALSGTRAIAEACAFSLDELRYEYPLPALTPGRTVQEELAARTYEGAAWRYPDGLPERVRVALRYELDLIESLSYAPYFLTVHDIVRFAKSRGILCQGRGSAANSAVCYCLGITAVDPARADLLFERFVSAERNEPPDIDVDFEHERREEVIQHIYETYGRDRAGLAATVIRYRTRSAVRDIGKVFGLSADKVGVASRALAGLGGIAEAHSGAAYLRSFGLDPEDATLARVLRLAWELKGFPRHLSQHVGGFVITRGPLSRIVPIENAAMAERTVIEWDKDDLDALGMLKIDVLALGMLTCLQKGFDLIHRAYGRRFDPATLPGDDPAVYEMLSKADSIGVFQVESRAQMSMLPRLKPATFYDLVIQIAIVRPGPIQGDMVHPYLRRRTGEEAVDYPSPELRTVLGKTLGVPLFQEQAMRIAIVAAGFTPAEADRLRRAMAGFRRPGTIQKFRTKLIAGMIARGYAVDFAERCFRQIEGFGEYGFPESHAASFALLAYASAWIKYHYPAAFAAALLNSQPMGFYAPAQIVGDARAHGVEVRPIDVNASDWDCLLEEGASGPALRLGFRQIRGLSAAEAAKLVTARGAGYATLHDLQARAGISFAALTMLARADACRSLGLGRRRALWDIRLLRAPPPPLFAYAGRNFGANAPPPDMPPEEAVDLPAMTIGEEVLQDYATFDLSLKRHPIALLRPRLAAVGFVPAAKLATLPDPGRARTAGLVLIRQRPGTASGVIFATLEDETGIVNLIIWSKVFARYRRAVLESRLLGVSGRLQRQGPVLHLIAEQMEDLSGLLAELTLPAGAPLRPLAMVQDALPAGRNFR